jgi:hypothetical protein
MYKISNATWRDNNLSGIGIVIETLVCEGFFSILFEGHYF